jgi:hypothetical protein
MTTLAPRAASAGEPATRAPVSVAKASARDFVRFQTDERERRLGKVTGHRRTDCAESEKGNVHDGNLMCGSKARGPQ